MLRTLTALVMAGSAMASAAVTWTAQTVPPLSSGQPVSRMTSVSCGSSSFCVAVPADGPYNGPSQLPAVEIWNGSAWSAQTLPAPSGDDRATVSSVSCASAASCVAVGFVTTGSGPNPMLAEMWNGSAWTAQIIPELAKGSGALAAVSCDSPTSCTAVGNDYPSPPAAKPVVPLAEHWNGTKWIKQTPAAGTGAQSQFEAVSCPSASDCTAVGWDTDSGGNPYIPLIETWQNGTWQVGDDSLPAGEVYVGLSSVSCTTAATCVAAGTDNAGNGSLDDPAVMQLANGSWTGPVNLLPKVASEGSLTGVSCTGPAAATVCTAAGGYTVGTSNHHALAEYWNGHSWASQTIAPTTPPTGKTLEAVSCAPGTSDCEAVGYQDASNKIVALAEGN